MRSFCVGVLVLAFSLGLTVGTARGQYVETYWQGAPGAPSPWTTASNWSNGLPGHFNGSMSEAYIQNGGTATISGLGTTVSGNVLYLGVYFSGSCLGGNVIQSSGTVNLTEIIFNPSVNAQGNPSTAAYTMSGGSLFVGSLYMQGGFFGGAGNGIFQQTSGTVSAGAIDMIVFGGSATYSLSNGLILTHALTIGGNGSNVFLQTGGSVVGSAWGAGLADAYVTVGQEWYDAPGRYNLYGPGQLATSVLFVTPSSYFDQTAGTVTVNSLFMSGNYHFTGGSLAVSRALTLAGTLDFGGTAESVTVGDAMVDLSQATIINGSQASFSSGPHSLVLVNPSFNGPAVFGGGWNPGNLVLVKNPGGPLVLGPGQGFQGWGNITNHLTCSGTIDAGVLADGSSRGLNLTNGVNVNSGGWINLRSGDSMFNSTTGSNETGGTLNVHDTTSSLATGGTLIAGNEDIGTSGGAGTFTQSGGTNMPGQLLLGYADGTAAAGAGAYYLSGNGIVTAGSINLGLSSPGLFVQSSGTCTVTPGSLVIGSANYQSTYQLSGGTLNANGTYGTKVSKVGSFNHTGGIHNATTLGVGTTSSSGGQAYYTMSAGATLNVTGYEDIGGWGNATFTQNGGTHTMTGTNGNLNLGGYGAVGANILSLYQLNAGILNVGSLLSVGGEGPSTFTQTGGTSIVTGLLRVGGWSTDNATYYAGVPAAYNLGGGVLSAGTETIGHTGSGTLTHTAGSNTVSGALALGDTAFGNGTYNLSGAASQLTAASLVVSNTGTGAFVQNSGTVTVSGDVVLGQMGQSGSGSFAMGGGTLSAVNLIVGRDSGATHGTGLFKTTSSAPVITLTGSLYLGQNGSLNLAPGTTIHMAGSAFANMSQTPSCAASMSNLTLIFEGGTGVVDTFEVASKDLGTGSGSAVNNFVLGTLQIGGIRPGQVQLVNQVVNETGTGVTEILYVKNLVIGNGSYLDLNHQKVYYSTLTNSGTVNLNGGTLLPLNNSAIYSGTETATGGTVGLSNSGPYYYGQVITVTASAQAGYFFGGWSVTGPSTLSNSTAVSTSLTVDGNFTLTANFSLVPYTLTASASPAAGGTVTASPSQATYNYSNTMTITASANPGYTFVCWTATGGAVAIGGSATTTLTITNNCTLAAVFSQNSYSGTETETGGTISESSSGPYVYGQVITVTASAQAGYAFSGWSINGPSTLDNTAAATTSLTVYGSFTLTANFTALTYTVTAQINPAGTGTLAVSPSQATYHYGDTVTITASANPGQQFVSWTVTGGTIDSTSTSQATLTVQGNVTLTAAFAGAVLVTIDPSSVTWNDTTHIMTVQVNFTSSNGNTGNALDFGAELYLTGTDAGAFSGSSSYIRNKTGAQLAGLISGTFAFASWGGISSVGDETAPAGVDFYLYDLYDGVDLTTITPGEVVAIYYFRYTGNHTDFTQVQAHLCATGASDDTQPGEISLDDGAAPPVTATNNGVNLIPSAGTLSVTAATPSTWVYQNTPTTTCSRHQLTMTTSVTADTWGNTTYTATVAVSANSTNPTYQGLIPSSTCIYFSAGNNLGSITPVSTFTFAAGTTGTLHLIGGIVLGDGVVNSVANKAVAGPTTGQYTVTVTVVGDVSGPSNPAVATCVVTLRILGDVDGNGTVQAADKAWITQKIAGGTNYWPVGIDPAALDVDGNGTVQAADKADVNYGIDGTVIP